MQNFIKRPYLAQRLDLAVEATAALRGDADIEIDGISEQVRHKHGVCVHTVEVLNRRGADQINKAIGRYITCDLPKITDDNVLGRVAAVLAEELCSLLPPLSSGTLLVVGLGNHDAIPDALGPRTVELTYATRHLFVEPPYPEGLSNVCAFSPGVLGKSGIETAEIIGGVAGRLKPAAMLVVDALAAASIKRVGTTIQLADSGISPGSGIGNRRSAIDRESMGCPVIALGVPTVVDTAAIIGEAQSALAGFWRKQKIDIPPDFDCDACQFTERTLLDAFDGQLMVTPKDIDILIADMAEIIAAAIAIAVHPPATARNYHNYIR